MKRIAFLSTTAVFVAALAVSLAGAQNAPLGDLARRVRKQKPQQIPAGKTFDNDTLPHDDKLSVVGQSPEQTPESSAPEANANASANPAASQANSDQKPEDEQAKKQAMWKEWQTKIHSQQDKIDLATRELDVANREYRLRAASFYADAGNRLRNAGAWDKEDTQSKDQIAAKQKAVDDAKKSLEDMQEEGRKAGVPSSMLE
jgi:hypothetical protein